jgi:hypothetical protein
MAFMALARVTVNGPSKRTVSVPDSIYARVSDGSFGSIGTVTPGPP